LLRSWAAEAEQPDEASTRYAAPRREAQAARQPLPQPVRARRLDLLRARRRWAAGQDLLQDQRLGEAASFRDLYEETQGVEAATVARLGPPTFAQAAQRYLDEDTDHLALTTRSDRKGLLRAANAEHEAGRIRRYLGELRLDQIDVATLHDYWRDEVVGADRSYTTGLLYVTSRSSRPSTL
jgi:hypothetical protein